MQKIINNVTTFFVAGLMSWILPHMTKQLKNRLEENNNDIKYKSQKELVMNSVGKQKTWSPSDLGIPLG